MTDVTGRVPTQSGSGSHERYLAKRPQLQAEAPQVLRLADRITHNYPEFSNGALKAAMLYVQGSVHLDGREHVCGVRS